MAVYLYTYNAGAERTWTSRNEWPGDDLAIAMAEKRTGAVDPTIDVAREEVSGKTTPLGRWAMVNGKREWTKAG